MPVIDLFQPDNLSCIIVWEISESEAELLEIANMNYLRWQKLNSLVGRRRKEYLGLRACLQKLGQDLDLYYDEKGKPYLPNNHHISITHSYGYVAVGICEQGIGIDIELERNTKIANVRRKFISQREDEWLKLLPDEKKHLHIIWGIKESLYKLTGGKHWNFLHHYYTEAFLPEDETAIRVWLHDEIISRQYYAYHKKVGSHYLVWVLDYE